MSEPAPGIDPPGLADIKRRMAEAEQSQDVVSDQLSAAAGILATLRLPVSLLPERVRTAFAKLGDACGASFHSDGTLETIFDVVAERLEAGGKFGVVGCENDRPKKALSRLTKAYGDARVQNADAKWKQAIAHLVDVEADNSRLKAEVRRLTNAITEHAEQTEHNLCWWNDVKLWLTIGVDKRTRYPPVQFEPTSYAEVVKLPPRDEFMAGCNHACGVYYDSRAKDGKP